MQEWFDSQTQSGKNGKAFGLLTVEHERYLSQDTRVTIFSSSFPSTIETNRGAEKFEIITLEPFLTKKVLPTRLADFPNVTEEWNHITNSSPKYPLTNASVFYRPTGEITREYFLCSVKDNDEPYPGFFPNVCWIGCNAKNTPQIMDIASLGPKSDDPDVRPYYIFRARIGNGNVLSPEVRIPPTWTRLRNKPNIPLDPLDDYHYRKAVQEYMQSYLPIPQRILKATVLR